MTTPRRRRHDPLPPVDAGATPGHPATTVDLHAHTTRSDGVVGPVALVLQAFEVGVRTFALTDHDTLAGYREVVVDRAVPDGMSLLPGVEINAIVTRDLGLWEGELHILGLGMDPDDAVFEATLSSQRDRRRIRFERTVERLRAIDLAIDAQVADLDPGDGDALGRPTIARALIAAGHATSVEDAFRRLLGWGCPGYVPREGLGPAEAIAAIRAAGGLASLAHFSEAPARIPVLRELVDAGLGGLEVYYRSFDAGTVTMVAAVAAMLGLVPTGGTDYHGDTGTYAESHARSWVPPEVGDGVRAAIGVGSPPD